MCSLADKKKISACETMVLCEGDSCPRRWFHTQCVGLADDEIPESWYCEHCRALKNDVPKEKK